MDRTIRKRVQATPQTFGPYLEAESLFLTEQGREPDDLWELVAFLQANGDRRLIKAVRSLALKYQRSRRQK